MFTANFSFEFEYWKELHGAEMTAATSYDETYETTQIETNRTAHRMSFLQFLRYSYFVTNGFGIGPKLVFAERTEGGFMFSVNFNFIYVF
jgi:hypothetical protein